MVGLVVTSCWGGVQTGPPHFGAADSVVQTYRFMTAQAFRLHLLQVIEAGVDVDTVILRGLQRPFDLALQATLLPISAASKVDEAS